MDDAQLECITNATTKLYRIEEIPKEELDLTDDEMIVQVAHFNKVRPATVCILSGFLQVREKSKKLGNLSGQGKGSGKYFFGKVRGKSGKMKNWCHQMSDFQAKMHKI